MIQCKDILVVVDYRQQEHHALPRAAELARKYDANLTLISCIDQPVDELLQRLTESEVDKVKSALHDKFTNQLAELAQPLRSEGFSIEVKVVWNPNFQQGLLSFIEKNKFDLIVKTAHYHNKIQKLLMTPTDWTLMREAKTSLLLVKQGLWPDSANILGAININAKDKEHCSLNDKIIRHSISFAKQFNVDAHILNVFSWPLVEMRQLKHLFDEEGFYKEGKEIHHKALQNYVSDYSLRDSQVHLAEGLSAEETIPGIVKAT